MVNRGNFFIQRLHYNNNDYWLIRDRTKGKLYHTHIHCSDSRKTAEMVMIMADRGKIPKSYPAWMVESINRLWFGKGYMDRLDLNNENLLTNDPTIRYKNYKESKHGSKRYINSPKSFRK